MPLLHEYLRYRGSMPHRGGNDYRSITFSALTLMLLVANFAKTKWCKKHEKCLKPWHMGTHLRVLSVSLLMNTNTTGFRWLSKAFVSL